MFRYGLSEYSDNFKCFGGSIGDFETMYRNKKMFILKNLGTKGAGLYAYLSYFQIKHFECYA